MIQIQPRTMLNTYAIYILQDQAGKDVFMYYCKYVDVLSIKDAVKNPAFDVSQWYNLYIVEYHPNIRDAQNAFSRLIAQRGMPVLNMTHNYNRIGMIRCNETGHIYLNQAEVVRLHGVNSASLSKHLKRLPGHKTIKGMTFSRSSYLDEQRRPCAVQPTPLQYKHKACQAVRCVTTGQVFNSQSEACKALGVNAGQLSQHLAGHAGYRTVKGYTFERCEAPDNGPKAEKYRGG